jgi:hypothetical protein
VKFLRENSLSLCFAALFTVSVVGETFAGQHEYNADAIQHGGEAISWVSYVLSPEFGGDLLENWQSEFLQFSLYIIATVWLVQRGSNESKVVADAGLESDKQQRVGAYAEPGSPAWAKAAGIRHWIYSNSLFSAMIAVFLLSWLGQSINGWRTFNNTEDEHRGAHISYSEYLVNADFWNRTLQNWQSEFLAVGSMATFSIYLRQRGSPESKPVGAPHDETASSG